MVYKAYPFQALYCSLNSAAFWAIETDKIPALLGAWIGPVQVHSKRVQLSSLAQKRESPCVKTRSAPSLVRKILIVPTQLVIHDGRYFKI